MLFVIHMIDRPHGAELRKQTSAAHLEFVGAHLAQMYCGGPLLDDSGKAPVGSMVIMDFDDRASAEAFIAQEPYNAAGLFESVTIRRFGPVVEPGGASS